MKTQLLGTHEELLEDASLAVLHQTFNRQRQSSIDEKMLDVIAGFEAQTDSEAQAGTAPGLGSAG